VSLWAILLKIFGEIFGSFLSDIFGDWQRDRTNVALGAEKARADRLAAEAQANRRDEDAWRDLSALGDDALRERLRATQQRSGPTGNYP
jgi:hypothetical protein